MVQNHSLPPSLFHSLGALPPCCASKLGSASRAIDNQLLGRTEPAEAFHGAIDAERWFSLDWPHLQSNINCHQEKFPHHDNEHRPLTSDRSEVNQLQQLEHDGPRARDDPTRASRPCPAPDLRLPLLAAAAPAPRGAGPRLLLPPPPVPPHRGRRDQGGTRARRRRIGGWRRCGRKRRRRQRPEGRRAGRGRGWGGREDGAGPVLVAETHSRLRRARRSWWCNGIYEEWKPEILGCRRHISPGPVLRPHSTPSETCLCIINWFRYIRRASVSDGVTLQEVQEDIPSRCRVPCIPGHGWRLLSRDLA